MARYKPYKYEQMVMVPIEVLLPPKPVAGARVSMNDYPKNIKRLLREFAAEAYEKELSRELARLDESFAEWRNGKINSGELSDRIHQYETGASRELFKKYNEGNSDFNVAYAIITGILNREDVPEELIEAVDKHLHFYQSLKDDGELRMPGE